jgi:adenine-specific DNA-methyltransferase
MTKKNDYGQYFTPEHVADFMVKLSSVKKTARILEPASGKGIFIKKLHEQGYKNTISYEIDDTLEQLIKSDIKFESFISAQFNEKFDLIIGNPPYIRWKNLDNKLKEELSNNVLWNQYFNSLCDYLYIFILKSVELLKEKGELIFITPEYWINTKHAEVLRNYLVNNGYFSDIIHFNETPIFDKVASSILIFKFIKTKDKDNKNITITKYHTTKRLTPEILNKILLKQQDENIKVFERKQFKIDERWTLIHSNDEDKLNKYEQKCYIKNNKLLNGLNNKYSTLGLIADIGNGMVSGLDKAFQIPDEAKLSKKELAAVLPVLKAKNMEMYIHNNIHRYIFLNETNVNEKDFKTEYPIFYSILKEYREVLSKRYSYNRNINYWEWVFLRSLKMFKQQKEKIFVPCKERISHKNYFRFCFVEKNIYPTQDVTAIYLKNNTKESIYYILSMLNSNDVFEWLKRKGVVKGNIVEFSEKPLASIPIKLIDWSNKNEVKLHDTITDICKKYIKTKDPFVLDDLNQKVKILLNL